MKLHSIEVEGLFLYREKQSIDLTDHRLVVGVGENGVGKSAILIDAISLAFYGKPREKTTINGTITNGATRGRVAVEFSMNGDRYRVTRNLSRTASNGSIDGGNVEVQDLTFPNGWRSLVEKGKRDATTVMTELLGMGYEAAVMTWLATQAGYGKFSGAQPRERFNLLSGIFGLDGYAEKLAQASKKAKDADSKLTGVQGRIDEVQHSLDGDGAPVDADRYSDLTDEEVTSKLNEANTRYDRVTTDLADLAVGDPSRKVAEAQAALDVAAGDRQHQLDLAAAAARAAREMRDGALTRFNQAKATAERRRDASAQEHKDRAERDRVNAERQKQQAETALAQIKQAEADLPDAEQRFAEAKKNAEQLRRDAAEQARIHAEASTAKAKLLTEWDQLKTQAADAEQRIVTLERTLHSGDSECFACGQHLSREDTEALIASQRRDIERIEQRKGEVKAGGSAESARAAEAEANAADLNSQADRAQAAAARASEDVTRAKTLIDGKAERQRALREADDVLLTVDTAMREAMILAGQAADQEIAEAREALTAEQEEADAAIAAAEADQAKHADPTATERDLIAAVNVARAAAQSEIDEVETQRAALEATRQQIRNEVTVLTQEQLRRSNSAAKRRDLAARLKLLEQDRQATEKDRAIHLAMIKAFSPTGIPAMVLAGLMDDLNDKINASLKRLSRGDLQVRMTASKEGGKGSANDNKVTVYVDTPDGTVLYDSLSGGQKFRVDLAIRLGLTETISANTGHPIETFFLDEGYGSLDEKGIQDVIETMYQLSDSVNVVTVSHLAEIRDAFPVRVEVQKVGNNAVARVAA